MIVMALDHTRDFFSYYRFDPLDFSQTSAFLFLTRWITHYCAPVFVFLAGTGAFLSGSRGKSIPQLSRFLWTRGLWLVVLEFTIVRFAWLFNFDYSLSFGQVIWAIGVSMIVLSWLIHFPLRWISVFGISMILLHNLLDAVTPDRLGIFGWPWQVIHSGGFIALPNNYSYIALYPLIPWVGVMATGYAFGSILTKEKHERKQILFWLGGGLIAGFILLRLLNFYGDPVPWSTKKTPIFTILSFIKCEKYPPSLLYLLMTLGPAILLLPWLEELKGKFASAVIIYGRVPMFYYILHIYLIHLLAIVAAYFSVHHVDFLFSNTPPGLWEEGYGFNLVVVYLVWFFVVASLYPVCRWYAGVKSRSKNPLFSYL